MMVMILAQFAGIMLGWDFFEITIFGTPQGKTRVAPFRWQYVNVTHLQGLGTMSPVGGRGMEEWNKMISP
jgi:hypothetical protein